LVWEAVLAVLVELAVVEQRYRAVMEVLDDGAAVTEVAARFGVARQTLHGWLRRYAAPGGMANLADRSSRPWSCPHQMDPEVESRVLQLRLDHQGWGPRRARLASRWAGRRGPRHRLRGRRDETAVRIVVAASPPRDADPGAPPRRCRDFGTATDPGGRLGAARPDATKCVISPARMPPCMASTAGLVVIAEPR
jgi:transposase-like protein